MDQKAFYKQMIDFNRMTFDNTFQAMEMMQNQTESMARNLLDQAQWLPAEARDAVTEWMNAYKKGREQYKALIEKSFDNVLSFFK